MDLLYFFYICYIKGIYRNVDRTDEKRKKKTDLRDYNSTIVKRSNRNFFIGRALKMFLIYFDLIKLIFDVLLDEKLKRLGNII